MTTPVRLWYDISAETSLWTWREWSVNQTGSAPVRGLLRELRRPTACWRFEASRALLRGIWGVLWRSAGAASARWRWWAAPVPMLPRDPILMTPF